MKKIARRLISGISAAALLVSAVGTDAFIGTSEKTMRAAAEGGSDKIGSTVGFGDPEKDTQPKEGTKYYNTNYGLHTDKTAAAAGKDGRTFDVNLESWYVGENPVDVATILDASGSMAWTVDTLDPLAIDYKCFDDYEKANDTKIDDFDDLKKIQDANGGYLPQEIVDCILNPANTDNSKLSYNNYHYYVYEDRSSVSEFVPLGYWDGTTQKAPTEDSSLIGYYKFEGSLKNEKGTIATLISKPTNNVFKKEDLTEPVELDYSSNGLDLTAADKIGNVLLNIDDKSGFDFSNFTVEFEYNTKDAKNINCAQTPIFYIGTKDKSQYYMLNRGTSAKNGSTGNSNSKYLEMQVKGATDDKATRIFQTNEIIKDSDYNTFIKIKIEIKNDDVKVYKNNSAITFKKTETTSSMPLNLGEDFIIMLGGDELFSQDDYSNRISQNNIKNFKITSDGKEFCNLNLTSADENVKLVKQTAEGEGFNTTEAPDPVPAEAIYSNTHKNGSKSLNLTDTKDLGGILLDAVPKDQNNFSISFAVTNNNETDTPNYEAEIAYMGAVGADYTATGYYNIFRSQNGTVKDKTGDPRHIRFSQNSDYGTRASGSKAFNQGDWEIATFTVNNGTVTAYVNGKKDETAGGSTKTFSKLDVDNFGIILGGLLDQYDGKDILIDDLYVFDEALTESKVKMYFGEELCDATTYKKDKPTEVDKAVYHAKNADGTEFAQISSSLHDNEDADARRGWYYVNSQSNWTDVSSCLKGGKQYLGIIEDKYLGNEEVKDSKGNKIPDDNGKSTNDRVKIGEREKVNETDKQSVATVPPSTTHETDIENGNETDKTYEYTGDERSIRFYVDTAGYLRCFVNSGKASWSSSSKVWTYEKRTFCSLVYQKTPYDVETKKGQATKYEQLNEALNQFYSELAKKSDLTNSAVVRFSTDNAVGNLPMLVMSGWTNWSDEYIKNGKTLDKDDYLQDLLIPDDGEDAATTTTSAAQGISEYPYVMTGGTFTWTGLKSFYDNMVDKTDKSSGDRVYDIANDARDKYLIIFTDGRDNTQDYSTVDADGKPIYDETKDAKSEYFDTENVNENKPKGSDITYNGELAGAWADKLKDEGYTIYCVMMATGSISETANPDEYERANEFLQSLAGSSDVEERRAELKAQLEAATDSKEKDSLKEQLADLEKDSENHVIIVNPTSEGTGSVTDAFQQILAQIQQARKDYTVQDYIDPRFDLIGKDSKDNQITYHLGPDGEIIVTGNNGELALKGKTTTPITGETAKVKVTNIIDNGDEAFGLSYTPMEAENTSVESGTGYIYYDNVKDMYYLRWEDQEIPMETKSFNTNDGGKLLNVWSATIRLKAKDDFIGGNNILTNGNEAGENLIYSDATIENMDKNPELYFSAEELEEFDPDSDGEYDVPLRAKLEALSGTNRKINAVDAEGVSQAVYGDGIDIPSSGFPRTTVDVRLLPLNAKNLNDVVYMGEVISPTMMLADLENDYMTGSYYLQYLERYAYRLYGNKTGETPLLDLLNEWLKINDEKEAEKTFTIPYIYLPDPQYNDDGTLKKVEGTENVILNNSTGWDSEKRNAKGEPEFDDLNLRDVTGFITYSWIRADGNTEEQQKITGTEKYDITKEYVVKNTNQIKYNLQLKFTPLKDTALPSDFKFDEYFIKSSTAEGKDDSFFIIDDKDNEFKDYTPPKSSDPTYSNPDTNKGWSIKYTRSDYLKAMVSETHTYEPHVMYDTTDKKWVLVDNTSGSGHTTSEALTFYESKDDSKQTTINTTENTLTDKGVYDWDSEYKEAAGNEQIEAGESYTETPDNVEIVDANGDPLKSGAEPCSLVANTTYTKDVVNAALALELVVDGKYLKTDAATNTPPEINKDKEYTFIALRDYNDPLDPLPYGGRDNYVDADVFCENDHNGYGREYKLTFNVEDASIPKKPKDNQLYTVWAKLTKVEVAEYGWKVNRWDVTGYTPITDDATDGNPYLGYEKIDALPIGTYTINVDKNPLTDSQFKIASSSVAGTSKDLHFKYLNIDNDARSYTHDKFPDSVTEESDTAAASTGDGEYFIKNSAADNSSKNIAKSEKEGIDERLSQVKFYLGTVEGSSFKENKGESVKDNPETADDYAKDRLGIIMLSADSNALTISKEVTNTNTSTDKYKNEEWNFNVTIKTNDIMWLTDKDLTRDGSLDYILYTLDETSGEWNIGDKETVDDVKCDFGGTSTLTFELQLKHNQKAVFKDLPVGTWQVVEGENTNIMYTPHNNAHEFVGDEWMYQNTAETDEYNLKPNSEVQFINEMPYELPSAGGSGTYKYILIGGILTAGSVLFFVIQRRKRGKVSA